MRDILGILWIPIYLIMYGVCLIITVIVSLFTQLLGSKKAKSIAEYLLDIPQSITIKLFNV
jgi:hypothetical protein